MKQLKNRSFKLLIFHFALVFCSWKVLIILETFFLGKLLI